MVIFIILSYKVLGGEVRRVYVSSKFQFTVQCLRKSSQEDLEVASHITSQTRAESSELVHACAQPTVPIYYLGNGASNSGQGSSCLLMSYQLFRISLHFLASFSVLVLKRFYIFHYRGTSLPGQVYSQVFYFVLFFEATATGNVSVIIFYSSFPLVYRNILIYVS